MSYNIILNSSNLVGVNNNQFKYDFIGGSFTIPEHWEIDYRNLSDPINLSGSCFRFNSDKFIGNYRR